MRTRTLAHLALLVGFSSLGLPLEALGQGEESESQRRMAARMAAQMDQVWGQRPDDGTANIRILMTSGGQPFAGKVSIFTEFHFRAVSRSHHTQGFNPNENGRWVYEGLDPGDYEITVVGAQRFDGFEWSQEISVAAGDTPILEIEVPDPEPREGQPGP